MKKVLWLVLLSLSSVKAERPNILFIAVDDLRPELGLYGGRALTPNIDKLASTSLTFNRAYCNQAVCGASRTSLMTGLYPEKTHVRDFAATDWRKKAGNVVTLNQNFKDNGYLTLGLGKVYHGSEGEVDTEHWSQWFPVNAPPYFAPESLKMLNDARKKSKDGRGPAMEASPGAEDQHIDFKRVSLASSILAQLGSKSSEGPVKNHKDAPFFLAVGLTKPHLPFVAPQKYWDLYDPSKFNMPSNLTIPPGYPVSAANQMPSELFKYAGIPKKSPKEFPDELNRLLIHGYHAATSFTDANIGRLLVALDENGFADNTIVIIWGDHGWKLGDHSSWCKHTNFECDTRVPLIIHCPSMPKAVGKSDALVELIDMYPTLSELAGLKVPSHVQGKSFVPILKDPQASIRDAAYSTYPASINKQRCVGHSIRVGDYRYTEWWSGDKPVKAVATDISNDPGETTAVSDPELLSKLSGIVKARVLEARAK